MAKRSSEMSALLDRTDAGYPAASISAPLGNIEVSASRLSSSRSLLARGSLSPASTTHAPLILERCFNGAETAPRAGG